MIERDIFHLSTFRYQVIVLGGFTTRYLCLTFGTRDITTRYQRVSLDSYISTPKAVSDHIHAGIFGVDFGLFCSSEVLENANLDGYGMSSM